MKAIFKILTLLIIATFFSCSNSNVEDDVLTTENNITTESYRVSSQQTTGQNGGKTFYNGSTTSGKTGENIDGMFLSNIPLIEYRYLQEIKYDSIVSREIDDEGNVIGEEFSMEIVSRDTLGFESGILYNRFENDSSLINLYVGLDEEYLEDTRLRMIFETTDNLKPDIDSVGFLFISMRGPNLDNNDDVLFYENDTISIPKSYTKIVENIPTFDEKGKITKLSKGLEFQRVRIKQLQIYDTWDVTRDFRITLISNNGSVVKGEFSIRFVSDEVYEKRQCWLNGTYECKDFFEK
ncbi:MAG: hypothetical protein AAFX53_12625 [Bacteroidota bacterium]